MIRHPSGNGPQGFWWWVVAGVAVFFAILLIAEWVAK